MTATQARDFIIIGRLDAASYTLWDIAPAPTDLSRRQRVVEELGVETGDAFGQVDIVQGATATEALDSFLGGLRWASGNPDFALAPNSNTDGLALVSVSAYGAAKGGVVPVDVSLTPGPDSFQIIGWHPYDSTAHARIRGAMEAGGFTFPSGMLVARIADHHNVAGTLDLATACAILGAGGQLDPRVLSQIVLLGELNGFSGAVETLPGVTDAARTAHLNGYRTVFVPARQAQDVRALGLGLNVIGVRDLTEAVATLRALADLV
ncbi:magnesium chelatase domain-containing protein [Streptomyces sp. TE5632]